MKTYTQDDIGCYFGGERGQYIGQNVQELAASHGWRYSTQFEMVYLADLGETLVATNGSEEEYTWAWDEAEDFLNTLTADTVYFGGSEGGDWGLWAVESDEVQV